MNKSLLSQRSLKCLATRRALPLMAVALNKRLNNVDECFKLRPTGLAGKSTFGVALFGLSQLGLQKCALSVNLPASLRQQGLIHRFLSF